MCDTTHVSPILTFTFLASQTQLPFNAQASKPLLLLIHLHLHVQLLFHFIFLVPALISSFHSVTFVVFRQCEGWLYHNREHLLPLPSGSGIVLYFSLLSFMAINHQRMVLSLRVCYEIGYNLVTCKHAILFCRQQGCLQY